MTKENLFYRLRNLDRLLGKGWQENGGKDGELEKQEIYFASLSELNDPMEGFNNVVFKGDEILWYNFFKHYIECLEAVYHIYLSLGANEKFVDLASLPFYDIFHNRNIFFASKLKETSKKIHKDFEKECGEIIDKIAKRTTTITMHELHFYLMQLHTLAPKNIRRHYSYETIFHNDTKETNDTIQEIIIKHIDTLENATPQNRNIISNLFMVSCNLINSMTFGDRFQQIPKNMQFIEHRFPNFYMQNLDKLMCPEYYTASFLKEAHSSSVWGHYADGHKGVCLIFKGANNFLHLFGKDSFSEKQEYKNMKFKEIDYSGAFENINFFENVCARLTGRELPQWYIGKNGEKSPIIDKILSDEWRKRYWQRAEKRLLVKTRDWSYEKEYRLVINSFLKDNLEKQDRVFKYDFKDLDGIILGINTPLEAVHKIINIIEQKCKENDRKEFNLYRAYYCEKNKNIQFMPLPTLYLGLKSQKNNVD